MFVLCNSTLPLDESVTSEKHKEVEVLQQNFDSNEVCVHLLGYNVTILLILVYLSANGKLKI